MTSLPLSWLNCQLMPNLSVTMPYRLDQKVSCSSMPTSPPSPSSWNRRRISSSSFVMSARLMLLPEMKGMPGMLSLNMTSVPKMFRTVYMI